MRLLKPNWVHHDEKPIFSIDIHQDGKKFATGGQGIDSGRIVIWNMQPVLHKNIAEDKRVPKILCTMDNHLACVNCVRWSQKGEMLASGSDDKLVMIWKKAKGASGVFGTGGLQINLESWKCIATLRGHSGDVLDLAWSPQDVWLASCSVDNSIAIWDVATFTLVAPLRGHTGLVKGITWDPVGKFLASQSDDRSVKIWNTSDWTCSQTITEPFEDCGGTTHILRLAWSPDGQYLVSAHAMNGGGPTAQIIEREAWKCDKDFVGHRKAVTCVRFHNSIIKRTAAKNPKPMQCCCLAIGSRDRSLSVWMTSSQRPLVVMHDLFADSVLDLSWGSTNYVLLACSNDGRVAGLQFDELEFGRLLPEEEKLCLHKRVYGQSALMQNGTGNAADEVIENPELLNISQEKVAPPAFNSIQAPLEQPDVGSNSFNLTVLAAPARLSSGDTNGNVNKQVNNTSILPAQVISQQKETRTADGKRRIVPVFIPTNQDASETTVAAQQTAASKPTQSNLSTVTPLLTSMNGSTTESSMAKIPSITSQKPDSSQSKNEANLLNRLDPRLTKSTTTRLLPKAVNIEALPAFPASQGKTTWAKGTRTQPGVTATLLRSINSNSACTIFKGITDYRIQVENGAINTPNGMLAKVTALTTHGDETLWETFIGSPVVNFNLCSKYVLICCFDGTLRLLDIRTSLPLLPIMALASQATQCTFCPAGRYVGVITECGLVRIWDVKEQCAFLATTCNELLQKYGSTTHFHISEQGVPFISFQQDATFSYSTKLQTWFVLSIRDPMIRYAASSTMPKSLKGDYNEYPVLSAQSMSSSFASGVNAVDLNTTDWHSKAKIVFCENQIKLCEQLNSPLELKHCYQTLAYQIATCGDEKRLRLLLDDLLNLKDLDADDEDVDHVHDEEPQILSIPKMELFESCLKVIKPHTKWQRIYKEYEALYELQKRRKCKIAAGIEQQNTVSNDQEMLDG